MARFEPVAPATVFEGFDNVEVPLADGGRLVVWAVRDAAEGPVVGFATGRFDALWEARGQPIALALDVDRAIAPPAVLALPGGAGAFALWAHVDDGGEPRLRLQWLRADGTQAVAASLSALTSDAEHAFAMATLPGFEALGSVTLAVGVDVDQAGGPGRVTARLLHSGQTVSVDFPSPGRITLVPLTGDGGEGSGGDLAAGDPDGVVADGPIPRGPLHADVPPAEAAGAPVIGSNLLGVSDWASSQPFIDIFKASRPWVTTADGVWDTGQIARVAFDPEGWVRSMPEGVVAVSTILFTNWEDDAHPLGRYVVTWEGAGDLRVDSAFIDRAASMPGRTVFDYRGEGPIRLDIPRPDPASSGATVRNIRVFEERLEALLDDGEIFHPVFLSRIEDMRVLRFMDWQVTNDEPPGRWSTMPSPDAVRYVDASGVPLSVMVDLANQVRADPWFCIPHLADDDFVRQFAAHVRDNLDPGLVAYVQFSNEVWNFSFPQAHHAYAQAAQDLGFEGGTGWLQWYGMRAAQVAGLWKDVFAERQALDRTRTVFEAMNNPEPALHAPDYVARRGIEAPHRAFDVYATNGYFGHGFVDPQNLPTIQRWLREADGGFASAFRQLREGGLLAVESSTDSLPAMGAWFASEARIAHGLGLEMVVYEGGSHIADPFSEAPSAEVLGFYAALHERPEMGAIYRDLLSAWKAVGGTVFVHFTDAGVHSRYGSFGLYPTFDTVTSARADAIDAFQAANSPWWQDGRAATLFDGGSLITGWRGERLLEGTPGPDRFHPLSPGATSTMTGGAGDDRFMLDDAAARGIGESGAGGDIVVGGDGTDVAVYRIARSQASVDRVDGALVVRSAEGVDRLSEVERLWFADAKLAFDLSAQGAAGRTALALAVLLPSGLASPAITGAVLGIMDEGRDIAGLCRHLQDVGVLAALAGSTAPAAIAAMAARNVLRIEPAAALVDSLATFMDGRVASHQPADFLALVAGLELTQTSIGLIGLQQTGLAYL